MAYETALAALADPTRRAMFERLRRRPHAVGELARALDVTQPAASQHLAVLRQARLVKGRREGTRRIYSIDFAGLASLRAYLDSFWDEILDAYAAGPRPARRSKEKQ